VIGLGILPPLKIKSCEEKALTSITYVLPRSREEIKKKRNAHEASPHA
jgi:hypothetical protein